jgi:hypothetical protein
VQSTSAKDLIPDGKAKAWGKIFEISSRGLLIREVVLTKYSIQRIKMLLVHCDNDKTID